MRFRRARAPLPALLWLVALLTAASLANVAEASRGSSAALGLAPSLTPHADAPSLSARALEYDDAEVSYGLPLFSYDDEQLLSLIADDAGLRLRRRRQWGENLRADAARALPLVVLDYDAPPKLEPLPSLENRLGGSAKLTLFGDRGNQVTLAANPPTQKGFALFAGATRSDDSARNRWLDTRFGVWTAPDPVGAIDSENLYAFGGLRPAEQRDPLGLCAFGLPCPGFIHRAIDRTADSAVDVGGKVAESMKQAYKPIVDTLVKPVVQANVDLAKSWWDSTTNGGKYTKQEKDRILGRYVATSVGVALMVEGFRAPVPKPAAAVGAETTAAAEAAGGTEAGGALAPAQAADEALYARGTFRKQVVQDTAAAAPRGTEGEMLCPTCREVMPEKITIETKRGPVERRGFDLDHYPDTWAERVKAMKARPVPPTRKEVLDEYNRWLRAQCPTCNQGHEFEGVPGPAEAPQ